MNFLGIPKIFVGIPRIFVGIPRIFLGIPRIFLGILTISLGIPRISLGIHRIFSKNTPPGTQPWEDSGRLKRTTLPPYHSRARLLKKYTQAPTPVLVIIVFSSKSRFKKQKEIHTFDTSHILVFLYF